jgi:hypothetical protein
MAQILDPIPPDNQNQILCCYVNATSHIQIARISNIANWYFERVVFPGQRLVFEALPDALLEIHTGMMASAILSDTIPCTRLCVDENGNYTTPANTEQDIKTTDNKPVRETINAVSSQRRFPEESLTLAAAL